MGGKNSKPLDERYLPEHFVQFKLFGIEGRIIKGARQALEAARQLLSVNFNEAESLVAKKPFILSSELPEVKDRHGRTLKDKNMTLFRVAAAAGAFNPRDMKTGEENYGLVERFAAKMSQDEVRNQLSAQFPPGWEEETAKRMKPYSDAIIEFGEAIINTHIPAGSTVAAECKPVVEHYLDTLKTISSKEVISTGLIFDLQLLIAARKYYSTNVHRFATLDKQDLFLVIGYGSLVDKVAPGDEPIIQRGTYPVMIEGELPARGLKFSSGLGASFFMDDLGWGVGRRGRRLALSGSGQASRAYFCQALGSLCQAKARVLKNLCSDRTIQWTAKR